MVRLLDEHPLATLVWTSSDGPAAERLPMRFDRGAGDGAHGTLRVIEDAAWLRALVGRLTDTHDDTHEAPRAQRWRVDDAPADCIASMLAAVVGIEIPVERIQGKRKASQNRSAADRAGVTAGPAASPGDDARAMAALLRG